MDQAVDDQQTTAVVVPLFDPPSSAAAHVAILRTQARVVLVNDGSPESSSLEQLRRLPGVTWIELEQNMGIAAALNAGVTAAIDAGAGVLVTLDQDSRPAPDLIRGLVACLRSRCNEVGNLVGPGVVAGVRYKGRMSGELIAVSEILQSGMTFYADTYVKCGPFDERLFIDGVDTEYCLRIRRLGGQVLADPALALDHTLGVGPSAKTMTIARWRPVATGHAPFRRYYMTRNRLELIRRYGAAELSWAAVTLRQTLVGHILAICTEPDLRRAHAAMIGRGLVDFVRRRFGPLRSSGAESPLGTASIRPNAY